MDVRPADPNRLLAGLARDGVTLDLKTIDVCFLAALYLRADRAALASFEEEVLLDVFEQVCDLVEPGADSVRKRATHAVQRLREQRMLARVDGAGVVRAGEYALTRLAAGVVEYFLADEALTRESLTLLTRTLLANLSEIRVAARDARDEPAWREVVVGPLRVTVMDLVGGIERRQRGMDAQQEDVQREVGELLQADWFGAVDRCQDLLDTTTGTLRELNEVLLRDTQQIQTLLQEIGQHAADHGPPEAEEAVQRVVEQVDRVGAWGRARQTAWTGYYQYVHRFLRDVVRMDPDRALSQRLRDQLARHVDQPFALVAAAAPRLVALREVEARIERPRVTAERRDREAPLEPCTAEDVLGGLEARVRELLTEHGSLAEVTAAVLRELPERDHFVATGRVAAIVAEVARARSAHERAWVTVDDHLEIEDWTVTPREVDA